MLYRFDIAQKRDNGGRHDATPAACPSGHRGNSIFLEIRKDRSRTRGPARDAGAPGDHLFVGCEAETAIALRGADWTAGEAQGFKPAVYWTKTCVHCLGSFGFLPRHDYILHRSIDSAMHLNETQPCEKCMGIFIKSSSLIIL